MELTASFMFLLEGFRPVFTDPSHATFCLLMTGWVVSHRRRYVTDLIISSDSVANGHFSDYHRFFSHAKWQIDLLWKLLANELMNRLVGPEGVIVLAGDDTLCHKRGLGVFGTGMHHDPLLSSKAVKIVTWGHDWVTLCLVVVHPWWAPTKVFSLPICMRLYRNKQGLTKGQKKDQHGSRPASKPSKTTQKKTTKKAGKCADSAHVTRPELMREMLKLVASWFPHRRFLFVGDSLYTGNSVLNHLPSNMDMIGAVHPKGAMYEPAPKVTTKKRGAPRKKGDRLSTLADWAADDQCWQTYKFDQYGLHGTFDTKTRRGLYYKAGKDRLLQFVLTRNADGKRPTQIFYCTNLEMNVAEILSTYAHRWSIEVTHHDAKQFLGFEDPANRVPLAVRRTAPMAMFLYSLTVLWYAEHGHKHVKFPERPWYYWKREPSFADMLTTLRRVSWEDKLNEVRSKPTLCNKTIGLLTYLSTLAG